MYTHQFQMQQIKQLLLQNNSQTHLSCTKYFEDLPATIGLLSLDFSTISETEASSEFADLKYLDQQNIYFIIKQIFFKLDTVRKNYVIKFGVRLEIVGLQIFMNGCPFPMPWLCLKELFLTAGVGK